MSEKQDEAKTKIEITIKDLEIIEEGLLTARAESATDQEWQSFNDVLSRVKQFIKGAKLKRKMINYFTFDKREKENQKT